MNIGVVDDAGTLFAVVPFLAAWLVGWLLLWRDRPLPLRHAARRPLSVIVPARDEAHALPHLLAPLLAQLAPGDEVIVVDDGSRDGTAAVAIAHGARVVTPPPPPEGWLGKPHACWHGATAATHDLLVFLDADVRPRAGLIDGLAAAVGDDHGALVSVQPWHTPGRASEQLSAWFNVAALAATGRFTPWGARVRPRVAFGPVLALDRATYDRVGGHAAPEVRRAHTEDIALARAVGRVELYSGRDRVAFRMYPGGWRDVVAGWTRSIATGAGAAPRWATLATAAWTWALAAAPFVAWWAYALAVVQWAVVTRRAGRFSPWLALVYPIALAVFVIVVVRSSYRVARRRDVRWKGRDVAAR